MTQVAPTVSDLMKIIEPITCFTVSRKVQQNSFRLDAITYIECDSNSLLALLTTRQTERLDTFARVFDFGPFKRTYIHSSEYGVPMLTSAEMMELDPTPSIMAKADSPKWNQYQVERGWILVSCSGTIGNVAVVPSYWDGWAVSQDAIRVVPKQENRGLVWAFLSLPTLKSLVVSKKSGSVIDHIYEEDIASLGLPNVPEIVKGQLNQIFDRMLENRESSGHLHDDSISQLLKVNSLPPMVMPASLDPEIISMTSDALTRNGAYRLDAHYYNLAAQLAISNIRKCPSEVKTIGDVTERVVMGPRFKRNYVEASHGVPFLSGKNIIQVRPTELRYLSNIQMSEMQELLVERVWTLITCSGTIGRACFVWDNYENYAASQHILRVIPNELEVDPGYLYAFLSSPYGYQQILRYRHGSVIDEITDKQLEQIVIPRPSSKEQEAIGDKVREAYEKRAEAIRLEDEAQAILTKELAGTQITKGV